MFIRHLGLFCDLSFLNFVMFFALFSSKLLICRHFLYISDIYFLLQQFVSQVACFSFSCLVTLGSALSLQQKEFIDLIVHCANVLVSHTSVSIPFADTYPYPRPPLSLVTHSTLFWNIEQGVVVSWGPAYLPPSTLQSFLFSFSMTLSFPN